MRKGHLPLFVVSLLVMTFLLGGGVALKVGAAESSYRQAVLFAEVLSLVLENYVDPVEADGLLVGAYQGMLAGLDPNGAYLTPDEVQAWKASGAISEGTAEAGFSALKTGRVLQVVAVDPGSSAEEAGLEIGDQISAIDGIAARNLSLGQAWRLLRGEPGSKVEVTLLRPDEEVIREELELLRSRTRARAYEMDLVHGIVVVRFRDLSRVDVEALTADLHAQTSEGRDTLLLDLRNVTQGTPRDAGAIAGLFSDGAPLELRDRSGRLLESVPPSPRAGWTGKVFVLVNGATVGGAEALAMLLSVGGEARVFGEATYGLGAEPRLYELDNGAGLLLSAALWSVEEHGSWNAEGVQPDELVHGEGEDYSEVAHDQLGRVIDLIRGEEAEPVREAA
jgi:carboxyl-terminal processing protease